MLSEELKACPACGRTLKETENGYFMCPTEDAPEPAPKPITLLGYPIQNPFAVASGKSVFSRMHDQYFAKKKQEWY